MKKYCSTWQIRDDNRARARGLLDIYGYKHTLILRGTAFPLQHWLHERSHLVGVKQSFRSENSVARLCPFKDTRNSHSVGEISGILIISLSKAN